MPEIALCPISHSVLASQIKLINGVSPRLAQEGLEVILGTSHTHMRQLGIQLVDANPCTGQVKFVALKGMPPGDLHPVADKLSTWMANRIAELLPERHARQQARAT
ncbi:MAG: hypothetical protein JWN75_407 [Candidatus Saccharibacteria bacterium]|nr:hypothetical protein [Candidatus Saccharibacteria bacterium]